MKELEDKKSKQRELRLKKVRIHLTDLLTRITPEANQYEIFYKPVEKSPSMFNPHRDMSIPSSLLPTYRFFLKSKSNKEKYGIMLLHREDIDKRISNDKIVSAYQIPTFESNIREGIEHLQQKQSKK